MRSRRTYIECRRQNRPLGMAAPHTLYICGPMPFPNPPEKIVPFNSGPVASHDIGRQFEEHRRSSAQVIDFLKTIVRDDGRLKNGLIGAEQLDPDLPRILAERAVAALSDLLENVKQSARQAQASAAETRATQAEIAKLREEIASSASSMAQSLHLMRERLANFHPEVETRAFIPPAPVGVLGPQHGNFYATDAQSSTPLASDYAQVSVEWAEHMPDTIPPNILAINAITGDHWSSRWWANRAASAFGMLAWWYMGAWPSPGPPTTPNTPTGQPIPPGTMYFDTDLGMMLVWNGSSWVNPFAPSKAVTASLYYLATAGQTVFPFSVADLNG